ncbi:methyl-accepting chemotaxis protein [Carboxylicivirga sp. M1479]|uniref:methyl-accepting chemotaxis protein n=1 Tax=Carboxylicivirga sp. M1479 TaxID=2594476 RepID=UPI001177F37F|nr:methyl-accepting chemotaxis protein [Carboxylicivirga sp. M1479]TRX71637.1 hypothetical protein FNN09_05210 [Carboxylicivirga sp. M1479]
MNFKNLKISQQLAYSFGLVLAIFVISNLIQINRLNQLGNLEHEGAARSEATILVTEADALPYQYYAIIADAIILRDIDKIMVRWNAIKEEASTDISAIASLLDTDAEKRAFSEVKRANSELINLFENVMVPALRKDVSEESGLDMAALDEQLIDIVTRFSENLLAIRASLMDENAEADELYDSTQSSLVNLSIIFLVLAIVLSIIIVLYITRAITQTLGGEPNELDVIAKKMANGDLTIDTGSIDKRVGVVKNMLLMVNQLRGVISSISNGADNISSASQQLSSGAQSISSGVSEQAASAEEVSSSMEEMAANIQQNTENALQTREISTQASNAIEEVVLASENSSSAVNEIYSKINVVVQIAEKTDLLAINAAVEAARAGEEGRGFAVVAAEVRKLAERSQTAASEIVALAENGMKLTNESTGQLKSIVPNIQQTSQLVDEIASASQEQETGASQVNSAIQQLSMVTQQNASSSEEMASSSEEMSSQASELEEITSFFTLGNQRMKRSFTKQQNGSVKKVSNANGHTKQAASNFDMGNLSDVLNEYENI